MEVEVLFMRLWEIVCICVGGYGNPELRQALQNIIDGVLAEGAL